MTVQEILFGHYQEISKDGGPLFLSQADLARAIIAIKGAGFENKSEASVKALINQALRPRGAENSRPLGPRLRKAIFTAIEARLDKGINAQSFLQDLEIAIRDLKSGMETTPMSSEKVFQMLKQTARQATTHFIVTYKPAENKDSPYADQLIKLMSERLSLTGDKQPDDQLEAHYIFYVKSRYVAIQFWKRLSNFLIHKLGLNPEKVLNRLKEVNNSPYPQSLNVYTVNPILCVNPLVVFDPERKERQAFSIHYVGNQVSISILSAEDMKEWEDEFYLPLITDPHKWDVESISCEDALQSLTNGGGH